METIGRLHTDWAAFYRKCLRVEEYGSVCLEFRVLKVVLVGKTFNL